MLTIETRSFLEAEKSAFTDNSVIAYKGYYFKSNFTARSKSLLAVLVPVFLLLIPFFIIKNTFDISGTGEAVLLVVFALAGLLFITWKYFRKFNAVIDATTDKAEVIHVTTNKVYKKENPFGPGMAFYADVLVGNVRKTLYLYGAFLEQMDIDKKFPSTEFEIVRSFKTKQVINFLVLGDYLQAEKILPAFTREELQTDQDIRVIDITIDEVK